VKGAILLACALATALAMSSATPTAAVAQSTSKAKPIEPLKPPRQANTPSGFNLLQKPSNNAHNPNLDPARKKRGRNLEKD